jgi:hypothetical protein
MQMQVPFGVAHGRLSATLRFAQDDKSFAGVITEAKLIKRSRSRINRS